jgi:hypothetical protein
MEKPLSGERLVEENMKFRFEAWMVILVFSGILHGAPPVAAEIIDVFDNHVTVQVSGKLDFKKGDQVGLTYLAGKIEMFIGIYEIIQAKENVFVAKEVASSMPVSRGMKIQINPASSTAVVPAPEERTETATGAMEDESRDPRSLTPNQEVQKRDIEKPAAATVIPEIGIEGKVIEVLGDKVRVSFTSAQKPRTGFTVEISGRGEGGVSRLVGLWEVTDVRDNELLAKKQAADEEPCIGQAARIYDMAASPGAAMPANPASPALSEQKGIGFEEFQSMIASRGPRREQMSQRYKELKNARGKRSFLGIEALKNTDIVLSSRPGAEPVGLVVVGVCPGSPAEKAGFGVADVIIKVNGLAVNEPSLLEMIVMKVSGTLHFELERDGQVMTIEAQAEWIGK